ncbi:MAG: decarboxylating 6-phosphogluconate dehydrogenase [Candidatus Eisenbacteria bacterium]|uniref:Decarboxylating 6-phosphogluconate dehydrogenase n=1 Tax=Eiseniibacteriota bacterium TaxID=2212470 RepID=A0A849SS86_UNCEI|nr:decarboxylating 6-phosphogluconate dehydrogenase [Candidatus Eisenbacteria bacterium]
MDIGFVGLGRMGLNMTRRLLLGGHRVVAFDRSESAVAEAVGAGAVAATSLADLIARLGSSRVVWMMIPSGKPVDDTLDALLPLLAAGDLVVDGGNSNFKDSKRRYASSKERGVAFVDCGTSGGIWGLKVGYCMMLGGDPEALKRLSPALDTLAPPQGWLHVGAPGSGHYTKMIHNGIEYGMMQAYAEGFEILQASEYKPDLEKVSHLWNQGSVVRSWLLELAVLAFRKDPALEQIRGYVEDSGEGRWTVMEAIDLNVPAELLTLSLLNRFRSRQSDSFRDRVLAALRAEFGGHAVKAK